MNNTVTLSQSVMKRLEKISTSSRLTPQSIISEAIDDRLDYEEWALEQIDAGLADINAGRVLSDDEFWKQICARHESKKAA
jgi:predicted transcriptional regulator